MAKAEKTKKHELVSFCSCGWKSAAIQRDKAALVALWKDHFEASLQEVVELLALAIAIERYIQKEKWEGHDNLNESLNEFLQVLAQLKDSDRA